MRTLLFFAGGVILNACSPGGVRATSSVLTGCWGGVPTERANQYVMEFEGIYMEATEGGIFSRSARCPEYRMRVTTSNQDIRERFIQLGEPFQGLPILGAGFRAHATITLKERRDNYHFVMELDDLRDLRPMSEAETRRFIEQFDIG